MPVRKSQKDILEDKLGICNQVARFAIGSIQDPMSYLNFLPYPM